jgi:hypothetical protein
MPGYVSVLKSFAMENRGLYAMFLLTVTHPGEDRVSAHLQHDHRGITAGGKQIPQTGPDPHRRLDFHSQIYTG